MFNFLKNLLGRNEAPTITQDSNKTIISESKEFKYLHFLYQYTLVRNIKYPIINDMEIDDIEKQWNISLPLVFREFFKIIGKYGIFFIGSNEFQTHQYFEMRAFAKSEVEMAGNPIMFNDNIFVFSAFPPHRRFWFVKLDEGENPPVYYFEDEAVKEYDSVVECIKSMGWYQPEMYGLDREN